MEKSVKIDAQGLELEGRLYEDHPEKAAIITHPHPLYGGDMDNGIVTAIAQAYQHAGWTTLRFNFRGTGNSQGHHDNGEGEQHDIQAAVAFLLARERQQIQLAGYSFGAWVLAHWSQQYNQQGRPVFMVSPPVAFIPFPDGPLPGLKEVFTGSRDDLAPPEPIRSQMPRWQPDARLTIIENTDHFFGNQVAQLINAFSPCIDKYSALGLNPDPILTKEEKNGH